MLLTSLCTLAHAQTAATAPSGKITYEGLRRIDMSRMRMNVNGQDVRPGSGDAAEGMPDVISFTQKLIFAGSFAKEERDRPQNPMRQNRAGNANSSPDGAPTGGPSAGGPNMRMMRMNDQETYLDMANRQRISIMTVRRDSTTQRYRTERPFPKPEGWQTSDKTKKIAGYVCHKATVTRRNAPYTIWYTTDLPFTYSPVADLTPDKGVVLQIESDDESYKASAVSLEPVDAASLQPPTDVKTISSEEMEQIRRKQMADFRQRMMQNGGFPGRN
ncbi:GLPGLI family protein [Spirosoma rhododendri]|uniref:GLPGLI family protein n=2 Tax=Spirosoma rhododendri TaxID=2728024 RepID=A0A7L5DSB9_9BACT|nr:GLPGLI family protein [Spirosoma rhododendri]